MPTFAQPIQKKFIKKVESELDGWSRRLRDYPTRDRSGDRSFRTMTSDGSD
ncbi:MAG: hypothetical protein WCC90_00555 [Methylocella sp.]